MLFLKEGDFTQIVTGEYGRLYQKCFDYAKPFLFLPYGIPTLYMEECPSNRFPTIENASETLFEENGIVINRLWAEGCLRENILEFEFIMFHELRHYHQRAVIKQYRDTGSSDKENESDIKQWIIDYSDYKRNNGDDASRADNAIQMIERDANAYALSLLRLYHAHDSMGLNLGLPDITASDAARYEKRLELCPAFLVAQRRYQNEVSATQAPIKKKPKIGRNAPCPCGSGLKYKKCRCLQYHEEYR